MEMQEGFSIREYASRMRSVNVVNCWPFDETAGEETVKSLLPPIIVRKFTWWLDELHYMHSESDNNKKKVVEKGETSSRNTEDRGDDVVKVKGLRGLMKAQKKRSIKEIVAVAPQVERTMSGEEEDSVEEDDGSFNSNYSFHEEINWGPKGKRNQKKDNKKKMKNNNILSKTKRVFKKIKKKKTQIRDDDDEMGLLVDPHKEINCFKFKTQAQDKAIGDPSSSYSKEFENDISDCVSILKRKPRLQPFDACKETMPCNAFKLIEQNHHPGFPPRGILRNHVKEISQQQSTKCILQEAVQVNHGSTEKSNKHVTFSEKDRLSRQPSHSFEYFESQKKVCGSYTANAEVVGKDSTNAESSRNEQNNEEEFFSRSLGSERRILDGMNPHLSESGLRDAVPNDPYYAYPSGFFCMPLEGPYDRPSINALRNSSNSTCRRLNKDYLETYNEASVAQAFMQSTAVNNNAHSFQFQTFPPRSPKELLHAFYSLPDENQTRNICGRRSLNGVNEDFVGLPLNSQGELITLSSSANRDFNQLNLFPVRSYVEENPSVVIPSRLGISESRTDSKTNLDFGFHKINDHRFHDSGNTNYQMQKSPGSEKIQSTMRLMGKEFIVGSRGFQELEDEHIWKDKQIVDDTSETSFCPSEFTMDRRSESMYNLPHFDSQTSSMYQGVFVGGKIEPVQKLYPSLYPGTLFPEPFTSGYESQFYSLELPAQTAANQEARPNVRPTAVQLRNKQNLPHSPISAIRFPFMHPDLVGHAKSSWSQRSSLNRAPSCFDVSEKGTQYLSNSQSQCSSLGRNHPHLMPRDSHRTDSSGFCLFSPMLSESASQSSISPASLAPTLLTQHTIMPRYPGVFPVSAVQKTHGNKKKIKERIKSRTGIRGFDTGKKCKGQLSAQSNVPLKMPTFGFDEDSQCAKNPIAYASFEDSVQNIETAVESCSATAKTKFVIRGEYEADKDEQIISPCMDSCTDTVKTGSIKLTAGTKHILKACQRTDQTTTTGFTFSESENSAKIYRFSD